MKRGITLALFLLVWSCDDPIMIEPIELSLVSDEELLPPADAEIPPPVEIEDPIGANISPSEVELVNVTIPIRVVRRRVRGRIRVFRTFPIPPEATTDDPALTLARLTASEEGWESRDGMGAIMQIARNVRSRTCDPERHTDCVDGMESILSAFRRLSSRLTGQQNPTTRRGLWTSSLPAGDVEEPPPYWRECPRGREGARARRARECDGTWSAYREHWNDRQVEAEGWISRPRRRGPCRGRPMAWGCPDCGDDVVMMRRNQTRVSRGFRAFERLECGDTRNSIWGIPPDEVAPHELLELVESVEGSELIGVDLLSPSPPVPPILYPGMYSYL